MEEMTMMMRLSSPDNQTISQETITTTTSTSWKLYENPFYYPVHHQQEQQQQQCQSSKHHHRLHLPLSTHKIAASFWDLSLLRTVMESELDFTRAQVTELKAELEYERKARKQVESMNKRLARELAEERRGREAMERVCEQLAREVSSDKAEIDRMKREIDEERKMLRMAEVLREERVQMKLAEAKLLYEEKLFELEETKHTQVDYSSIFTLEQNNQTDEIPRLATISNSAANLSGKFSRLVLREKTCDANSNSREPKRMTVIEKSACYENNSHISSMAIQRRASPEPENPHIKRGIKGFVEFPRVVRAIGSKSRQWGTKLECQKAQLRILLKQKSPIRSNSLIMS